MSHQLEAYYPGDPAWEAFVDVFAEEWKRCAFADELLSWCGGHRDIAMAVYGVMGEDARRWMETEIPALDELRPRECIASERLRKRLRSMLMRI